MRVFLDSSALAKRYVAEAGSERVVLLCAEADEILLSLVSIPEITSALCRLRRERKLSAKHCAVIKNQFASDVEHTAIIDLNERVMATTIRCLENSPVRTLDAIHVASAHESNCDLFVTADKRQYSAALALELTSEFIG